MTVCEGCGQDGAVKFLRYAGSLGDSGFHVHHDPSCARAALEGRGGGKWLPRDDLDRALDPEDPMTMSEYARRVARKEAG